MSGILYRASIQPESMKRYEYTGHTADVGLIAYGETEAEAFENAAAGMFGLICDMSLVKSHETMDVEVKSAGGDETLLADWLNELLYLYETREMLFGSFVVDSIEAGNLRGKAIGEPLDRERHVLKEDIKAVTYHMLEVGKTTDGWRVQVLFDV